MLRFLLAMLILVVAGNSGFTQIPDEFTNLKVLDSTIDKRALIDRMRSFSFALDVRCNYCHVGENPNSLEGYDFASDEKPAKRIARLMMQMVDDINTQHISRVNTVGEDRPEPLTVECVTCHHGQARPITLGERLEATWRAHGADSAVAEYRAVREQYHGLGTYDFGEHALNELGILISEQSSPDAIAILELNREFYPDSWAIPYYLGQLYTEIGDTAKAVSLYEEVLQSRPEHKGAQLLLQVLQEEN